MDGFSLEFEDHSLGTPLCVDTYYLSWLSRRLKLDNTPQISWAVPGAGDQTSVNELSNINIGLEAVGVVPNKSLIQLHPFLYHRNAPQFILKYLIFSGALMLCPKVSLEQSKIIALIQKKYESKANRWLSKYGFEPFLLCYDPNT